MSTLQPRYHWQIRSDTKIENGRRIDEAKNESEYWKVVNDINKPQSETKWKLHDDKQEVIEDEEQIATRFNEFFVNKIEKLKANI